MNFTRDQLLKILAENREELRRLGVRRLGLFGYAARDEATSASDVDFLVEFENQSCDAYMELKEFLENQFACRVDLVLADVLKARLRDPILKETV